MLARPCAGDIEKPALGFINIVEVRFVGRIGNALVKRQDSFIASHHGHGAKFQPLGEAHRGGHYFVGAREPGDRGASASHKLGRSNEQADLGGLPAETPIDEPRLLRRSVELIVDNKVRTKADLLHSDICLGAADVQMLASLPVNYFLESASVVAFEPKFRPAVTAGKQASILPLRRD